MTLLAKEIPVGNSKLSLTDTIEQITGLQSLSTISKEISVSVENRNIGDCPYFENIWQEYFQNIDASQKIEVKRTIDYLYTKFAILFPLLEKNFSISDEVFLNYIAKRLSDQIEEAQNSGRKFTNGTIGSLKSIERNGDFILEKIPYWAFGSTNVSLDIIRIRTNQGEKTLREIMESIGYKNEKGEFYLPNSLGVSVMIQLSDGAIIAQERNNKAVLTQYAGLTSSASGAVSIMESNSGTGVLGSNASAELQEELGLDPDSLPVFPQVGNITGSMQEHILKELGVEYKSGVLVPVGVVMERKRHNPEVVFTLLLPEGMTFEDIKKKWENAQDKWESIQLKSIAPTIIENQVSFYNRTMPPELRNHPTGLEEYIKTLPRDTEWAGPHLLMSYLAWLNACDKSMEDIKGEMLSILK